MGKGRRMQKKRQGMIRPGKKGEEILTYVCGRVTSEVKIEDDTSMVVRAPTVDSELYVLSKEKFEANWMVPGEEIQDNVEHGQELKARGFLMYKPKPGMYKWVYRVTADDLGLLPGGCFVSSWGAKQPVKQGDFLAMPAHEDCAKEIYLMPSDVLSCYTACGSDEDPSTPFTQDEITADYNKLVAFVKEVIKVVQKQNGFLLKRKQGYHILFNESEVSVYFDEIRKNLKGLENKCAGQILTEKLKSGEINVNSNNTDIWETLINSLDFSGIDFEKTYRILPPEE